MSSESASLTQILSQLETTSVTDSERKDVYSKFSRQFTANDVSLFSLDVAKNVNHVIDVVIVDIDRDSAEISQSALHVLGFCLHDQEIVRDITSAKASEVIKKLCACILKTEDKTTCTRALWCLGKQNMAATVIQSQVDAILTAVDFAMEKWTGNSITVEHECVNTVARVAEQTPKEMACHAARWGKIVLPLVSHSAIKIRERALAVIESRLEMLLTNQRELLAASLVPVFKSKVCEELRKLLANKHELYVLKCWGILVQIFGEELHRGSFINSMLPIIELGFKSLASETKIAAFTAWQQLIDCFATNLNILSDQKRIKLVMQVFKMNNAKTEEVAQVKFNVWWHFIWLLGNKISANFDMVAVPMLQFCVGGAKLMGDHNANTTPRIAQNGISPVTPKMNLTGCPNSQWPVFKFLQLKGCEVLAHFLGSRPQEVEVFEFTIDCLRNEVITGPAMFVKYSSLFITAAIELFINLGKDVPDSLLFHIWYLLVAHMKNAIESVAKLDMREAVTVFLKQFQVLVLSRVLSNSVILKMFEGVCCLPKKVLCSSAYNIGGGEMIHGTPALFLMEVLLTPALLQTCPELEKYHTLFSNIIASGPCNTTGSLGFREAILQLLDQNAGFVENSEIMWRFWSAIVHSLQELITKTNEINQGDSLEHNFSCVYKALLLPVKLRLPASVPPPTLKTLSKTWTELYKTVNRLAAMVTNAEANIICEHICQKILDLNKEVEKLEPATLEFEINSSHVIVSSLDFSSLGGQSTFGLSASPAKWAKKRHRVLENIHSLVLLLNHLQNRLTQLVAEAELDAKSFQKSSADKIPLQGMLNTMVDSFSTLFTHVTSSTFISAMIGCLAQPIGELFQDVSKRTSVKLYNNPFQQKMEKLWMDITTCLQSRYQSVFDSEFLLKLSPLLEATFLHSRRQIKNQTLALWNVTFGKATTLIYPEALKPVLSKVKEKSVISLPGWVSVQIPVIEETPISQMSQSQAPEPHIPGMPSPHKLHGSFLNKAVSPNVKKSPAKTMPSPKASSARKKVLGFDSLDDKDFVVIQSSPRKPRVLTEHQKEVMKERKILPAMYNTLENSQDVSMMAHFNTDTQDGSQSGTPTPTLDTPFSVFGSIVPSTAPANKQERGKLTTKIPEVKESSDKKADTTGFKSPEARNKDSSSTVSGEPIRTRRRSVRFKEDESIKIPKKTQESDFPGTNKKDKNSSAADSVKNNSEAVENSNDDLTGITEKPSEDSLETIESEVTNVKGNKAQSSITKASEKQFGCKDVETILGKCDNKLPLEDSSLIDQTKPSVSSETENGKLGGSEGDKDDSLSAQSIPQNVLGALGPTPESSSKSSGSKSETVTDNDNSRINLQQDDDESQPLFSWTQKLNQLNKSPINQSPLRKIMSPERRSSPQRTRTHSPVKSPRRAKKTLTNENYGNLDRWIIKSPVKNIMEGQLEKDSDNVLTVGSATIVEETQSPTKFMKNTEGGDKMESIMETPPKHSFSSSSFGHSNRKLFQGSQENRENIHDLLEDSNIIAASPNSKSASTSLKPGTPILKLTKLTDSEIKKYSPRRDGRKELDFTPTKLDKINSKSDKKKIVTATFSIGGDEIIDASPKKVHKHDDFSGFHPLENNGQNNDTDIAILNSAENIQSVDNFSERMDVCESDSEQVLNSESSQTAEIGGLFSQIVREAKLEAALHENNIPFEPSADIFSQESFKTSCQSLKNSQKSQGSSQEETQESQIDTQSQMESQEENEDQVKTANKTPRSRKRKQETPKKTTPDDAKKGRKKKADESLKVSQLQEIGSAKKISKRLQEKREKQEMEQQEMEQQSQTSTQPVPEMNKKSNVKEKKTEATDPKDNEEEDKREKFDSNKLKTDNDKRTQDESKEDPCVTDKPNSEETTSKSNSENQNSMTDKSGNIINFGNKTNADVNEESKIRTLDIIEEVDNKEKKNTEKSAYSEESKLAVDDEKSDNKTRKSSKKELKSLRKKLSSSQEEKLQKTPESRNSSELPERKSTTKKRKEVAQKRVLNRGKDIVVNDSDSNLDQDFSDEALPLSLEVTKNPVAENLEKKIHEQLDNNENALTPKSVTLTDKCKSQEMEFETEENNEKNIDGEEEGNDQEAMDVSFCSDDIPLSSLKSSQGKSDDEDIPLSNLKSSQENTIDKLEMNVVSETKEKEAADMLQNRNEGKVSVQKGKRKQKQIISPVRNKLRSSGNKKTRLRSGEKKFEVSPGKKKVSLALKHVNKAQKKLTSDNKNKSEIGLDVSEIEKDAAETRPPDSDKLENLEKIESELVNKESVEDSNLNTKTVAARNVFADLNKDIGPLVEGFSGMKNESTSTDDNNSSRSAAFDILDETPTKETEGLKRLPASVFMRNSDSKLIVGSRKFEKRQGLVRRSILKPSSMGSPGQLNSPKRDFHPIKVARIYSPTASPSASILKKRRLSGDTTADTNSPPAKQRRVSFAEPLTDLETQQADSGNLAEKNIPNTQKPDISASGTTLSDTQSTMTTITPSGHQSTQGTPTPNTYQSTQESQLDDSQAVYPDLTECAQPVEKILPQITSAIWSRGLGLIIRARNIHTVGDLAAMTEVEIDSLPIKTPKVQTLRKVLDSFNETLQGKKSKTWKSPKPVRKAILSEEDPIPVRETAKEVETQEESAEKVATEVEKVLASSGNLIEEIERLSKKTDQSEESQESHDVLKDQSGSTQQTCDLQCAQSLFREIDNDSADQENVKTSDSNTFSSILDFFSKCDLDNLQTNELYKTQDLTIDFLTKLRSTAQCRSPKP